MACYFGDSTLAFSDVKSLDIRPRTSVIAVDDTPCLSFAVRQKTSIPRRSRLEHGESGGSKSTTGGGGPFVPYAIYDYFARSHELAATGVTVRKILDAEKVDRAYFCSWLRERSDQLIIALNAPQDAREPQVDGAPRPRCYRHGIGIGN
jgi:hypothetical protein